MYMFISITIFNGILLRDGITKTIFRLFYPCPSPHTARSFTQMNGPFYRGLETFLFYTIKLYIPITFFKS